MTSGNDLRSWRSWLNAMYPQAVIHVQRNTARIGKPWFYLEIVDERMLDRGRAYHDMIRTMHLHLVSEGAVEGQAAAPESFWKTREVLDHLCQRLNEERVVPAYLFGHHYPLPVATFRDVYAGVAQYPIGAAQYAVSAVNSNGEETLPSAPLDVANTTAGKRLFLVISDWPRSGAIATHYRVYFRRTSSDPWVNILYASVGQARRRGVAVINRTQTTEIEIPLTSLTAGIPNLNHDPPQTSRVRYGHLKVQDASVSMTESSLIDDAFHGFVKVRYASHSSHHFTPTPIVLVSNTTVSATIT